MRKLIIIGLFAVLSIQPAIAQFGNGIVFDPTNYRQNLITAIRNVEQVNNQIRQLENDIRMLANQAEDLTRLDFSAGAIVDQKLAEIEQLIRNANSIAMSVAEMESAYAELYPDDYVVIGRDKAMVAARAQWQAARRAYGDTLLVQAQIADAVNADRSTLDRLITESQTASGNLQVTQAGNQLVALQTKQLMQQQVLIASQYRAEALERARAVDAEEIARARFSKFVGDGTAYKEAE
ncbi:P-type conjugative transfer protein TrbJ [Parvularcula sp. IMCC14364]|uniref:P-type conjugative transfer protein TrbJ n=1 Tax=Parvularcula sp. IMCC14364 TaxID=3067902 RepID=UPI0027416E7E|nr:P-type conjugative transfer protein TrbJ [Parvularcula sp. IMCC14364]